jgi:hypothetical protein
MVESSRMSNQSQGRWQLYLESSMDEVLKMAEICGDMVSLLTHTKTIWFPISKSELTD